MCIEDFHCCHTHLHFQIHTKYTQTHSLSLPSASLSHTHTVNPSLLTHVPTYSLSHIYIMLSSFRHSHMSSLCPGNSRAYLFLARDASTVIPQPSRLWMYLKWPLGWSGFRYTARRPSANAALCVCESVSV